MHERADGNTILKLFSTDPSTKTTSDFNVMNLNYYSMATASVVSDDYCCFVREDCCFVRRTVVLLGLRIILSGTTAICQGLLLFYLSGTSIILSGTTAIGPRLFQ